MRIEAEKAKNDINVRIATFNVRMYKFAKAQNEKIHSWSYGRLTTYITNQAEQEGILVRTGRQPIQSSSQEQGKLMAIEAYKDKAKPKKSRSKKSA